MLNIDFVALLPEALFLSTTIILCCYGLFLQRASIENHLLPFEKNEEFGKGLLFNESNTLKYNTNKDYSFSPIRIEQMSSWFIDPSVERLLNPSTILLSSSKLALFGTLICHCTQPFNSSVLCYNTLIIDNFTFYFKILLLLSIFGLYQLCGNYLEKVSTSYFESIVLINMSTISMLFLISAFDFITMYLAIELQSLSFYILGASLRNSEYSTEAGLKYFILGAFSSGILLLGFSIIYGFTGTTNCEQLWKLRPLEWQSDSDYNQLGLVFVGFLLISIGFLFKLTAAPFHLWAADVYEGSPIYVTALFSMAPKVAILAAMLRLFVYSVYSSEWSLQISLFILCSVCSMIVGAFAALSQNKIKRLLTFSGIGHVGLFLMGLSCGTIDGCAAVFVALFIYIIMTMNMFTIIHSLRPTQIQYIQDLGSIETNGPLLAMTLAVTMFSYAGIPPLAGFCSKFYLIFAGISSGLVFNAFVAILTSVVSCFYYIRLVRIMYFETPETNRLPVTISGRSSSLLLAINTFFLIFFFLYPAPLFTVAHNIACALCN